MDLYLTVDAGTSAMKLALFESPCSLRRSVTQEYALDTPQQDRVELDPRVYYKMFISGVDALFVEAGLKRGQVKAICICSQGETFMLLDGNGDPLDKATVWLDNRASEETAEIDRIFGREETFHRTGQQEIVTTWSACKLLWYKRNRPDVFSRIHRVAFVEDYLVYRLTGKHETEFSLLPSTLLFNIQALSWWPEMLEFLGISEEQLPVLRQSGTVVGEISPHLKKDLGFADDAVVITGAMDQIAGLVGAGNIAPGKVTETTGTAMAIGVTTDRPVYDPSMAIPCYIHAVEGKYVLLPWIQTAGIVLRWFRDALFLDSSTPLSNEVGLKRAYGRLTELAAVVAPGSDGLLLLPFLGGAGTPEFDSNAKGVFYGLRLSHTRGHFVRAILEAIAYTLRRNIDKLEELGIRVREVASLGGAARSDLWCQIKADVLQRPITRPATEETASLGLAILAAKALGRIDSLEEGIEMAAGAERVFQPDPGLADIYQSCLDQYQRVYQSLKPEFSR
jgi:xylulokinase